MTAVIFYLPTILLWLFTFVGAAAIGWRIVGWSGRLFSISRAVSLPEVSARGSMGD